MIEKAEGRRILKALSAILHGRADEDAGDVVNELAEFISTVPDSRVEVAVERTMTVIDETDTNES